MPLRNDDRAIHPILRAEQQISGYRLIQRIGRGGVAEVWEAESPAGYRVALKLVPLSTHLRSGELRALEIIREIRHPALLEILGTWQVENLLVIAMELADRSLWDRFAEAKEQGLRGIPRTELLGYLASVAEAIDYLNDYQHSIAGRHGLGVQHRDLKPQNILLVGNRAKVADFGLARVMEQGVASHTGPCTLPYAAPEYFGGKTSRQSDQYALAVTWCQLRGGQMPFLGTTAQITFGHLCNAPNLKGLPTPERPLVARALAKRPNQRWTDCRAFVNALRTLGTGQEPQVPETLPRAPEGLDDPAVDSSGLPALSDLTPLAPHSDFIPVDAVGASTRLAHFAARLRLAAGQLARAGSSTSAPRDVPARHEAGTGPHSDWATLVRAPAAFVMQSGTHAASALALRSRMTRFVTEAKRFTTTRAASWAARRATWAAALRAFVARLQQGIARVGRIWAASPHAAQPLLGRMQAVAGRLASAAGHCAEWVAANHPRLPGGRFRQRAVLALALLGLGLVLGAGTLWQRSGRTRSHATPAQATAISAAAAPHVPKAHLALFAAGHNALVTPRPTHPHQPLRSEPSTTLPTSPPIAVATTAPGTPPPAAPEETLDKEAAPEQTAARTASFPPGAETTAAAPSTGTKTEPKTRTETDTDTETSVRPPQSGVFPPPPPVPDPPDAAPATPPALLARATPAPAAPGAARSPVTRSISNPPETTDRSLTSPAGPEGPVSPTRAEVDPTAQRTLACQRGRADLARGAYAQAVAAFTQALQLGSDTSDVHLERGAAFHLDGRLREALADYDAAVRLQPQRAEAYLARARVHCDLGEDRLGLEDYTAAIRLREDANAHLGRGRIHHAMGDYDQALVDYEAALRLRPDDPALHFCRGLTHYCLGDLSSAIHDLTAALRLDPRHAAAYRLRGDAYARLGDYSHAGADHEAFERLSRPSRAPLAQ